MKNNQQKITMLQDLGMIYPTETSKTKRHYAIYECYCGKEFKAITLDIKSGNTNSCGCYNKQRRLETKTTHGLTHHRLYKTWQGMMARCYSHKSPSYKYYGEIGISVCKEWHNVENFINDMYPTFCEGLTLDRKESSKNYYKDNCRWSNLDVQSRNTRILRSTNTSGYRGVNLKKGRNKYTSQILVSRKRIYLGTYNTAIEAAKAYDNYVIENNLEHTLNFKKVQCK